jgi:hypothetical protein
MSAAQLANIASQGLDIANKWVEAAGDIGRGDIKQGLTKGGEIYKRFNPINQRRSPFEPIGIKWNGQINYNPF